MVGMGCPSILDVNNTIGWFTSMYPVILDSSGGSIAEVVVVTKEHLRSIPNKGLGYGALHGYQSVLPKISFNYLGQFNKQEVEEKSGSWSIVGEGTGLNVSPANKDDLIININGAIVDGHLQFSFAGRLSEEDMILLTDLYSSKLKETISYFKLSRQKLFNVKRCWSYHIGRVLK